MERIIEAGQVKFVMELQYKHVHTDMWK